jgi:hypothetical protein
VTFLKLFNLFSGASRWPSEICIKTVLEMSSNALKRLALVCKHLAPSQKCFKSVSEHQRYGARFRLKRVWNVLKRFCALFGAKDVPSMGRKRVMTSKTKTRSVVSCVQNGPFQDPKWRFFSAPLELQNGLPETLFWASKMTPPVDRTACMRMRAWTDKKPTCARHRGPKRVQATVDPSLDLPSWQFSLDLLSGQFSLDPPSGQFSPDLLSGQF